MGIFGTSSPFDQDVERATSENNTSEEWGLILEICDRAGSGPAAARDCLPRHDAAEPHADPHVQVHAATLLDACVANCGRVFHLEVASRDFEAEFRRLLSRAQPPVAGRLRALLRKWAEGEFRDDPQLDLIPSLHAKLSAESGERVSSAAAPAADAQTVLTAAERREQEELARAIALSLRDSSGSGGAAGAGARRGLAISAPMKVRALYDFEAAEDNELTFLAGEIVHVTDSSDPNWWKGHNERGEGLFPANFVTSDLTEPAPESENRSNSGKTVQFAESAGGAEQPARIDEAVVDEALALLHEADPAADDATGPRLARAEAAAHAMGALVDAALERADRRHARLTQLSADLVDALNLYHDLMRAPPTFLPPMHYAPGPAAATLPPPPPGALLPGPLPSLAPHHPQPPR
ncbi:signal transducing adapter molecule 1 like protein [Danaus plexippus plexippus]|uniref:Signal transducing adapter molecule 1 like protein n=1 Tax=Danaus plexippus plexippus TaxID=278856 RepID=A0A212EXA8_DANPL|nr:signal transducing adapter molecule 1 like protein [Danaus plexippus plexippus]